MKRFKDSASIGKSEFQEVATLRSIAARPAVNGGIRTWSDGTLPSLSKRIARRYRKVREESERDFVQGSYERSCLRGVP